MAEKQSGKEKRRAPKTVLRLPDPEEPKLAVLNSLSSIDAHRGYPRCSGKATVPVPSIGN
jgi:hypothetical protein